MPTLDAVQHSRCPLLHLSEGTEASCVENRVQRIVPGAHRLVRDQTIQPRSVNCVFLKLRSLGQLHQVLHRSTNITIDNQILQSQLQILPSLLSSLAFREEVSKLGVGELMNLPISPDRKVTPAIRRRLESDTINSSTRGSECVIRILGRDSGSQNMASWPRVPGFQEINGRIPCRVKAIKTTNIRHSGQRDSHCNEKLQRGNIDASDALRHRVLYLESRVQLQEAVLASAGTEKVLDSTSTTIPH
mmetsp:Transcript_32810/g.79009  ORF Transcript_32810/g.79009 Transcript_32810/m.79009 type:complete len:246 (-) Transcript_32810:453-1190(-)